MDKQKIYEQLKHILDLDSVDIFKLDQLGMDVWMNASFKELVETHGLDEQLAEKITLTLELINRLDDAT